MSRSVTATVAPALASTVIASGRAVVRSVTRSAGRGGDQLGDAGVGDDPAAADHDQVVGGVLQLAHQVAGHQHRAALGGQRAQEAAHPHDALGVQAVERLVQHQHRRVAEHRRGDAEPLAHAERVAAGLAAGGRLQPGLLDHLVDPPGGQALRVGQPQQVVAGAAAGLQRAGVQQRADVAQRVPQAARTAGRRSARCPRRPRPGRGSPASWWTCRRRSGRRSR